MSASARAGADTERGSSGAPSRAARYAAVAADCAVSITAGPRAPDGCLRAAIPDDSGGRCPCGLLLPERRPTQACTSSPEGTGVPGISVRSSAISQIPDLQPGGLHVLHVSEPKRCSIANLGVLPRSGMGDRQLTRAIFARECPGPCSHYRWRPRGRCALFVVSLSLFVGSASLVIR